MDTWMKEEQEWSRDTIGPDGESLEQPAFAHVTIKTEYSFNGEPHKPEVENLAIMDNEVAAIFSDLPSLTNLKEEDVELVLPVLDVDPLQPQSLPPVFGDSPSPTDLKQKDLKIEPIDITDMSSMCKDIALGVSFSSPTQLWSSAESLEQQVVSSEFQHSTAKGVQSRCATDKGSGSSPFKASRIFECQSCGKVCTTKSNLQRHLLFHIKVKPHNCNECGNEFASKGALERHALEHGSDRPLACQATSSRRPHLCDVCGNSFTALSSLLKHKRSHSTRERTFSCDDCGSSFVTKSLLLQHGRTHTGEGPYICDECAKRFATLGNLFTHQRTHTSQGPYRCHT